MKSDDKILKVVAPKDTSHGVHGIQSQRHPTFIGDHVTKSNSQETIKTAALNNKMLKNDSATGKTDK